MTSHVQKTVTLGDGTQATRMMVDIVFNTHRKIADEFPDAMTGLVLKSRDEGHSLSDKDVRQIACSNLMRFNGVMYNYVRSLVLTMTHG